MSRVTLHDKTFELSLSKSEIEKTVLSIANRINIDYVGRTPLFIAVLNGSFMFASDLLKNIKLNCNISFIKLSSYKGTKSSNKIKQIIGLNEQIEGREIIIIEDIIDSGLTVENLINKLQADGAKDIKIASLLFKPTAYKGSYKIDYKGIEIPNDFIVGYGLDYMELGRNLPNIYKICN